MRRLLLLRHGEAEVVPPGGSDVERALTANGRAEVADAADAIVRSQLSIDRVLVSTSRRTLDTAAIIAQHLHLKQPPEPQQGLYLAQPSGVLQALQRSGAACRTILLVGHNPGLSELAERLAGGGEPVSLRTAGVCLLTFSTDGWRDLAADIAESCQLLR